MATRGRLAVSKYKVCDVILVSSFFLLLSILAGFYVLFSIVEMVSHALSYWQLYQC